MSGWSPARRLLIARPSYRSFIVARNLPYPAGASNRRSRRSLPGRIHGAPSASSMCWDATGQSCHIVADEHFRDSVRPACRELAGECALMSLRARIIFVITMAALVLVIIGLTSILNMRRMANADETLYREGALPIPVLSHIAVSLQRMRIASRDLLAASGTARKDKIVHDIETLSRGIDTLSE